MGGLRRIVDISTGAVADSQQPDQTPEEAAQLALSAHAAETAELAGIQLNADPVKRAKARPIEECRSLKPKAAAVSTHVLHTTIEGVRVKLLAIVDDED
ncbi:MAG: hypothetical protein QG550_859 [Pseudomonadota bacterium]|nr:hypothetical protein [Pseudomonadota bacterium]